MPAAIALWNETYYFVVILIGDNYFSSINVYAYLAVHFRFDRRIKYNLIIIFKLRI